VVQAVRSEVVGVKTPAVGDFLFEAFAIGLVFPVHHVVIALDQEVVHESEAVEEQELNCIAPEVVRGRGHDVKGRRITGDCVLAAGRGEGDAEAQGFTGGGDSVEQYGVDVPVSSLYRHVQDSCHRILGDIAVAFKLPAHAVTLAKAVTRQ